MKTTSNYFFLLCTLIICAWMSQSCLEDQKAKATSKRNEIQKELSFEERKIANNADHWWAYTAADVDGDGIADLVYINQNSAGGFLAFLKGQKEKGYWEKHIIAETPPTGGLFASGDLEAADIDDDGDMDVIGVKHPGEWTNASATAELFWYENKNNGNEWQAHSIGTTPDFVKDVNFCDFDQDGKMDMSILTFDEHTLSIFLQNKKDQWNNVKVFYDEVLHEGMDTGDLNGDGFPDIVATGKIFYNPGKEWNKNPWEIENLDEQWNNQTGDWSRNGTKTFLRDIDEDGIDEIYMAHSERDGYPLAMYKKMGNTWEQTIIRDSMPANHTLQVYDFDLDGDYDVLAGPNKARASNLGIKKYDVVILLNEGDYKNYISLTIEKNGIYNGQATDYDGDGDLDIFRYPDHEATDFYLLENQLK